jgi:hypothetical protein
LNPAHGLFTSDYGLGWFDARYQKDRDGLDLWQNTTGAALANRDFCHAEKDDPYALKWGGWWGIQG